ncbi:MAG TPA: sterol desaturase family protein [Candidatus Binatia bacterium]|nr:sterol desaturase family protein [Candidatus Binatia bacterium]
MKPSREMPGWLRSGLIVAEIGLLLWLELRRPLRRAVESKLKRNWRNLVVAGFAGLSVQVAEKPVIAPLARIVEQRGWGLLKRGELPLWAEAIIAVALMDYTLYVWHVLVHRAPCLWRFHLPHHVDLDMDASTALRFHFSELVLSVPWRAGQIVMIGVTPFTFSLWQTLLMASILFHHSNVRLSTNTERWLSCLIVTPRLHGIHHSIVERQTNSNWSSGLTLWDWLHRTLRRDVPQEAITIGVPAYRAADDVTLPKVIAMPFRRQRPTWELPEAGKQRWSNRKTEDQSIERRS